MTADDRTPARRWWSVSRSIAAYAATLGILGFVILSLIPTGDEATAARSLVGFALFVVAFFIVEATALHLEIRRESHSISLSGIPLLLGVLHLHPNELVAAYVLGGVLPMIFVRRSQPSKVIWNACMFVCQGAIVAFITHATLGGQMPASPSEWLLPLAAVLAGEFFSVVAVSVVIRIAQGHFQPDLMRQIATSEGLASLAGTFAVTAAASIVIDPMMFLYALIPLTGVGALLRLHGELNQRHKDLLKLHGFSETLASPVGGRVLDTALNDLVQIMRAECAGVVTGPTLDVSDARVRVLNDETFSEAEAPFYEQLLEALGGNELLHITPASTDPQHHALASLLGATELLIIGMIGESEHPSALFVGDRLGVAQSFNDEEVQLFGSLGRSLGARLTNEQLMSRLEAQAHTDALTGLPNRLAFEIDLSARLEQPGNGGALITMDLDRFKDINDSLGHGAGDELLKQVASRLRAQSGPDDFACRFGGDEFSLIVARGPGETNADLERRVESVHAELTKPVHLGDLAFEIGASMGVSLWPDDGREISTLIRRADSAMYRTKREQRGIGWFSEELDDEAPRRLELLRALRVAIADNEFEVQLQPKVSSDDGHLVGVEALARWNHPEYGSISPMEFVPLLTQVGLVSDLTRLVIQKAVVTARTLENAGFAVPVALNLTPRDLLEPRFCEFLVEALEAENVDPSQLLVEVTEDVMIVDFDTSVEALRRIREAGVKVAIDDFGTGYSSLQHLHRLPVDQLKIDRSFVARLGTDDSAMAVVRASVNIARDLGLLTVAEGVEDALSLQLAHGLGCDQVQGYLVSRPLPVAEFVQWAMDWQAFSEARKQSFASAFTAETDVSLPGHFSTRR